MANLNKVLVENYDVTGGDISFEIPKTFHYKNFTIEAIMDSLAYPASENDAEIRLEDGECSADDGPINYSLVENAFTKMKAIDTRSKVRVVDLNTQNVRVTFLQGALNAGTLVKLTINFQS